MDLDSRGRRRLARVMLLFGTANILFLTTGSRADAAGFYLQEQSVRGWGRANSGEVADQGPASLWWNPAAIGPGETGPGETGPSDTGPNGTGPNDTGSETGL